MLILKSRQRSKFNKRLRPKTLAKNNYTFKKLFNKLRIVDNNNYPAFFKYKKKNILKYICLKMINICLTLIVKNHNLKNI